MKRMLKKAAAVLLAVTAAVGAMSGCAVSKKGSQEKVKLVWVMPGPGKLADSDRVWEEVNKKIAEHLPNVEVEFKVFSSSDYAQKVMLMQTTREKMDIINTGLLNFGEEARKQSFMAIDEYVDEYAKELKEEYPDFIWDYMKVDGKLYAVPSYQGLVQRKGIYTHKELADKYLDGKKLESVLENNDKFTEECYDVIEQYLQKLKDNGELRLGFKSGAASEFAWKGYETISDVFCVEKGDDKCEVKYLYQTPELKLYFDKMADWYKKGFIRKDILSNTNDTTQVGKENGYVMWLATAFDNADETATKQYGFDIDAYALEPFYITNHNAGAGGNAISVNSDYPEEAIKLLNLVNTNEEIYRLIVYGFEGEHYKKLSDSKVETFGYTGNATTSANYGLWGWVVGNTFKGYESVANPDGWYDYLQKLTDTVDNKSKLIGFTADTSKISNKFAQIKAVKTEYTQGLLTGAIENHEAYYNEFMQKLEMAGIEEVKAELQRQVDEFLASK